MATVTSIEEEPIGQPYTPFDEPIVDNMNSSNSQQSKAEFVNDIPLPESETFGTRPNQQSN